MARNRVGGEFNYKGILKQELKASSSSLSNFRQLLFNAMRFLYLYRLSLRPPVSSPSFSQGCFCNCLSILTLGYNL